MNESFMGKNEGKQNRKKSENLGEEEIGNDQNLAQDPWTASENNEFFPLLRDSRDWKRTQSLHSEVLR